MISRRDLLNLAGSALLAVCLAPLTNARSTMETPKPTTPIRCINIVNFIRAVEPRFETDLLLPVQKQMELTKQYKLPATWLLQYDALVSGPFVKYLKDNMPKGDEVGFWFEMNEMHCKAAGVEWRGRPGFEWDHYPLVAFTIGYTEEERIKLADAAMAEFKKIWGKYPKSVASWNLDAITIAHLTQKYKIDAYAVCRDQIATDGFTIWGAPIAGYYPSKTNCWSPAVDKRNQINTPILRMLGQDPVYYYDKEWMMPNGQRLGGPDTMEPAWISGRTPVFIKEFLRMIAETPTGQFAYAQLGQENSFPWRDQEEGYPLQMKALADLRKKGVVNVETMGDTGRRFKKAYSTTPVQAQVQLNDPFGNTKPVEASVWYQSRFYRANLHFKGNLPYLRDLTVYSDQNPQPFLNKATRQHEVEQKMPAVVDGYHWSKEPRSITEPRAGGFFEVGGKRLLLIGNPVVREEGKVLIAELPVQDGQVLQIRFEEKRILISLSSKAALTLSFEWDPAKAALVEVQAKRAAFRAHDFDYAVDVIDGVAKATSDGWTVVGDKGSVGLQMAQASK